MKAWGFVEIWKRIAHSRSRSFFVACAAFIVGVAVAGFWDRFVDDAILWVVLASFIAAVLFTSSRSRLVCLLIAALLAGFLRYNQSFPSPDMPTVATHAGGDVVFHGEIVDEVMRRSHRQDVVVGNLADSDEPLFGKLLLRLQKYPEVEFGDTLTFRCKPELPEPIEGFRYDRLLMSRGVLAVCDRVEELDVRSIEGATVRGSLFAFKQSLLAALGRALSEPHVSFVGGLLFGGSYALGSDLREDFSRTGVSHIMAASGYNVAIFSEMLLLTLMRSPLGRRRALIVSAFVILAYVVAAGATAAIVRAGAMAFLAMLALWLGRMASMRNILAFTAAVMLLVNPRLLLDDVGFQLSFVATIGIVALADRVADHLAFIPETLGFRESAAASLSAVLLTTPILLWHFGTISLIAPLANLLILPWIPYLMLFGALAMIAAIVVPVVASVVALPAWATSLILLSAIEYLSAIPLASVSVPFSGTLALLVGIVIAACFLWVVWKQKRIVAHS